jgi:hypothetical protein
MSVIRRFLPFNIHNEEYISFHGKIQKILYYAESRFWSILNSLVKADRGRQKWCQTLLRRELVPLFSSTLWLIFYFFNNCSYLFYRTLE